MAVEKLYSAINTAYNTAITKLKAIEEEDRNYCIQLEKCITNVHISIRQILKVHENLHKNDVSS